MTDGVIEGAAGRERLSFGAGFAFGVLFTMAVLAVVVATVVPRPVAPERLLSATVLVPILAAILVSAVASVALSAFALPERGFGLAGVATLGDTDAE